MTAYAELQVTSNYSFLRGGSHPDELVLSAKALGLAALGLADRNTLAGVVRAHTAAKQAGLKLLVGARLIPEDGPELLCYPSDRAAYGRLCRLLTLGKRRAEKGDCRFTLAEAREGLAEGEIEALRRQDDEHLALPMVFQLRQGEPAIALLGAPLAERQQAAQAAVGGPVGRIAQHLGPVLGYEARADQ